MIPTQMGPYSLGSRLGRGGMGSVYEATDAGGSAVAIKLLATHLADDPGLRRRFASEIDTLKNLRHPGIVQLLAYGEQDGQPYFAMELVRGRSLDKLLRAGRRFGWQETVMAAEAIARALKSAHDQGVIHRDLKPANLLLPDDAPPGEIKLADFGIARLFGGASHTALGNVVGTAEYMAPEQAAGKPLDARADLYALGLVMFAMLRGKPPFQSPNVADVMRMQQTIPPPRLATLVPDLPPAVDDLIHRLLAKHPDDRPASALAVARMLAAIGAAGAAAPAPGAERQPAAPDRGVDLLAVTRGFTPPPGSDPCKPHLSTQVAAAATQVEAAGQTRHTTLRQLDHEIAAAAERTRRRERWTGIAWAAVIAFLLIGGGYLLLRPLAPRELHERITAAIDAAADRQDGLRDAEPLIAQFLATHPQDSRAAEIAALKREIDIDRLRIRADRRHKKAEPPVLRIEHDYRQAMERRTSDPEACLAALRTILDLPATVAGERITAGAEVDALIGDAGLWRDLATWQIQQLTPLHEAEQRVERRDAAGKQPR
jgi:hypothetical protein